MLAVATAAAAACSCVTAGKDGPDPSIQASA